MTNRDDNDDSNSDAQAESKRRATPSSLGLDLNSEEDSEESEEEQGAQEEPNDESQRPAGPAIGGQASDASADDDPTRNISREEVKQTLMGMPAQGEEQEDDEQPDEPDPNTGDFSSAAETQTDQQQKRGELPSSQSLLEDSDDWSTSEQKPAPANQSESTGRAEQPEEDDDTRDVPVEDAQAVAEDMSSPDDASEPPEEPTDQPEEPGSSSQQPQQQQQQQRGTRDTMMGMGVADPEDEPATDESVDELGDDDIEQVEELDDEFGGEKTMVSSSPFAGVEEEEQEAGAQEDKHARDETDEQPVQDDLPEPGESGDLEHTGADFGEGEIDEDEDLEEFDEYEKTMVSDDVLEGPPSDFEESGLDVTSTPNSPATESGPESTADSPSDQDDTDERTRQQSPQQSPPPEQQRPQQHQQQQQAAQSGQPQQSTGQAPQEESDEDDFSSQKTEIFSSPFENEQVRPKLSVLEGPSSGQEYLLNETRNTIGRSTKNSVVVPDESMSRQHLEVVERPDGTYRVQDLQSVNGTYLNGTKVEEADIYHGDRIQTGRTTLQFLIPGDSPRADDRNRRVVRADAAQEAQPAASPRQTHTGTLSEEADEGGSTLNKVIIGATVLCAVLLGAIGYLWSVDTGPTKAQQQARTEFLNAIGAIQTSNWSKAETHLTNAKDLAPELPGLDGQFQRLETERNAYDALQTARSAAANSNFETAIKKARSVPRNSIYYDEAQELLRRQKRARRIERLLAESQKAADAGDRIDALSSIQQVLKIAPTHSRALQLRYAIKEGDALGSKGDGSDEDDEETTDSDSDGRQAVAAAASPGPGGGNGTDAPSSDSGGSGDSDEGGGGGSDDLWLIEESGSSGGSGSSGDMGEGFELYAQQKFSAAISHFESIAEGGGDSADRASKIASAIPNVKSSFEQGTSALANENWSTAVSSLRAALRADKQVDDTGHLSGKINTKIARAVAGQGMADLNAGNYADAYNHYKNARDYDSGHRAVRDLRRSLSDKASSLYIQAANSKKTNPAKSATLCRTITSMLPPEDKTYKKAKSLLNKL